MKALIALGSNLDYPHKQLCEALLSLSRVGHIVAKSSLYETAPVGGPEGQPNYLNAVIELEPFDIYQHPQRLLAALLDIEAGQGRTRRVRWDARTLDLDLLAMDDLVIDTEELVLPHPRMLERNFVLVPLCEIAPSWQHPKTGTRVCEHTGSSGIVKTDLRW